MKRQLQNDKINNISTVVDFEITRGIKETVIGYNLALTSQTARKIFNSDAPIIVDSASTNDPGRAYIKKEEKYTFFNCKSYIFQ